MKSKITFIFLFVLAFGLNAQNLSGITICVNPGHGGFDSDDRNMTIAPFAQGDHNGFWESQSNLDKGKQLRDMLVAAGANVILTRETNSTADDLNLSVIVAMANQNNSDFMLAIHSNAGNGVANSVLQLYAGKDASDATTYPTPTPVSDESRAISTVIAKNLYSNQITTWSSSYSVTGDKTFGRIAMGWSDGYGVLRGLTVPGVISEGMMHDYIPETYRLMNMEYKWLEAWNFFKSFCTYFKPSESIPTGNIAGSVRDTRIKLESSYNKFAGRDQLLPLNGAKLTLIETGETYTVDMLQNGVFVFKNLAPGVYHVKVENTGYYSQTQEITVAAGNTSYRNISLNRVRNTAPQVVSYSPNVAITDSVECSADIVLNFNWDMDQTSTTEAFSITPDVPGKITFEDTQYTLRFTPDKPLEGSTVYTVKLAKTASHPDSLSMTDDFSFRFLTKNRNRLALLAVYPFDGDSGVYYLAPSFRLVFDKKLNTSNIQTVVNVLDENGTTLAKNVRSVSNNSVASPYGSTYFSLTSNLTAGKTYTLVVDGDLEDEVGMKVFEPIKIKFKASNVLVTNQAVADDFETADIYSYDSDQSSFVSTASVARNTSKKLFGTSSYLFNYTFTDNNAYAIYKVTAPAIKLNNKKVIGLHVYGDMSGNEMQLQFTSGTDVRYVKLCDLKFYGWEFVETKLTSLPELTDYQLSGVKIVRRNGILSSTGSVYLDNMLLYDALIQALPNVFKEQVKVYPNPCSDVIHVSVSTDENPFMQLYSLNGVLLKEIRAKEMNVSDLSEGTYILKVKIREQEGSYVIMKVK